LFSRTRTQLVVVDEHFSTVVDRNIWSVEISCLARANGAMV
jgi:hypothetical protein